MLTFLPAQNVRPESGVLLTPFRTQNLLAYPMALGLMTDPHVANITWPGEVTRWFDIAALSESLFDAAYGLARFVVPDNLMTEAMKLQDAKKKQGRPMDEGPSTLTALRGMQADSIESLFLRLRLSTTARLSRTGSATLPAELLSFVDPLIFSGRRDHLPFRYMEGRLGLDPEYTATIGQLFVKARMLAAAGRIRENPGWADAKEEANINDPVARFGFRGAFEKALTFWCNVHWLGLQPGLLALRSLARLLLREEIWPWVTKYSFHIQWESVESLLRAVLSYPVDATVQYAENALTWRTAESAWGTLPTLMVTDAILDSDEAGFRADPPKKTLGEVLKHAALPGPFTRLLQRFLGPAVVADLPILLANFMEVRRLMDTSWYSQALTKGVPIFGWSQSEGGSTRWSVHQPLVFYTDGAFVDNVPTDVNELLLNYVYPATPESILQFYIFTSKDLVTEFPEMRSFMEGIRGVLVDGPLKALDYRVPLIPGWLGPEGALCGSYIDFRTIADSLRPFSDHQGDLGTSLIPVTLEDFSNLLGLSEERLKALLTTEMATIGDSKRAGHPLFRLWEGSQSGELSPKVPYAFYSTRTRIVGTDQPHRSLVPSLSIRVRDGAVEGRQVRANIAVGNANTPTLTGSLEPIFEKVGRLVIEGR